METKFRVKSIDRNTMKDNTSEIKENYLNKTLEYFNKVYNLGKHFVGNMSESHRFKGHVWNDISVVYHSEPILYFRVNKGGSILVAFSGTSLTVQ